MAVSLKNRKELTFLLIGILMLIIVVFYLIYSISFLIVNLNQALNKGATLSRPAFKFELDKAESLYKKNVSQ